MTAPQVYASTSKNDGPLEDEDKDGGEDKDD